MAKIGVDAAYPLNGEYLLMTDITLSNWTPIGGAQPFTGTFDGGGYTITLSGFNSAALSAGFAYTYDWIPEEGVFQFGVVPVGMFGYADGASIKNFTLQISMGSINLPAITTPPGMEEYSAGVGGAVGVAENTTLEDITVTGSLSLTASCAVDAGGLAGWILGSGSSIRNCVSQASVTVSGTGGTLQAGGIAGEIAYGGTISGCRATGNVSAVSSNTRASAGGIAAKSHSDCTITQSSSTGTVNATGKNNDVVAGGLVGEQEHGSVVITYCFATGNVSASGSGTLITAGGLIGVNGTESTGTVSYCYATGDVNAACSDSHNSHAGGLMGENDPDSSSSVSYCYATGAVSATSSGSTNVAGISSQNKSGTSITSCVALNPSVSTGGSRIARGSATLTNNYGLTSMSGGPWTNSATGPDGANVSATDAANDTWWKTTAGWNAKFGNSESAPWKWVGNRPKLWWE
jgi:hypothetical protein